MTQQEYEQKKHECWEEFKREVQCLPVSRHDVFCAAFDRAFALGKQEKDADKEEMLTCVKDQAVKLYDIANKAYAINGDKYYEGYMNAMIDLFGSKCLPDNVDSLDSNVDSSEPQPAEPKFKVGDKVRLKNVYEINEVDEDMARVGLKGCAYMEDFDNLEPYTEPTANYVRVDYHGADTAASTIADSCQSQPVTDYFDRIIKDGFRGHNRLHIAAQIVASMIGSDDWTTWRGGSNKEIWHNMAKSSLEIADALIAEAEKGGSK